MTATKKKTHWSRGLAKIGACADAVAWARNQPSLRAAWKSCERGDWMLWLAANIHGIGIDTPEQRALWHARADCAATALPIWNARYPNDSRVADCIQAVRDYADGKINAKALGVARRAAYAASASYAYAYAAAAADASADYAAAAAYAASASYAYAYAAAAADASAAADAARTKALARCADLVRARLPKPPTLTAKGKA